MKELGKERKIAIAALIIAVLMLTVAFAAMSRTLKINGTAKVDSAAWDIHFKSAEMKDKKGDAREVAGPKISEDGINLTLKVGLRKPKDEITYEAIIENKGDIDAEIESIEYPTLTDDQAKIIEFIATYQNGDEISKSQELKAGNEKTVKIVIRYKDITDESLLAKEAYDVPLTFKINYVQKGFGTQGEPGGDIEIEDDGSKAVLASVDIMSADDPSVTSFANSPITRSQIETLSFVKSNGSSRSGESWDASEAGDRSIIGYYTDSDSNGLYEVVIESSNNIYAPIDSSAFFAMFTELKEINFDNFRTDDSINMSFMFAFCESLTRIDLTSLDTSKVTDMSYIFRGCISFVTVDISNLDTSNVSTMEGMFESTKFHSKLKNVYMNGWDTLNVTNMSYMFAGCEELEILDFSDWDTSNVTDMAYMFQGCESIKSLDLSNFNTSKVTNMTAMFQDCSSLIELKLNSAEFNNPKSSDLFHHVYNVTIYVKDQDAADFINSSLNVSYATGSVVIQPLES